MIRDVVALNDGSPASGRAAACAVELCAKFQARLTILGLPRDTGESPFLTIAPAKVVVAAMHGARDAADAAARDVEEAARAAGVPCDHWTLDGPAADHAEAATRFARRFDLAVASLPGPDSARAYQALFETVLHRSGAPVYAVPAAAAPAFPTRVMIAWNGGRAATRAVGDAMPFLRAAASVEIVTVAKAGGRNADEPPGCDILAHLERHGVAARRSRFDTGATPAAALLANAAATGADLVVMGAQRHSRLYEAMLGGTTLEMMAAAATPMLMAR